jgi:hypothetical protein
MPANSSIVLTNLDFDALKNSFRNYLKSQDRFRDYDFDGSNMSVLLDILAYNTYHNAFYLNMVASEMFIDTAQLRDSVVSHAKELNYTPRSFTSATAEVDILITSDDPDRTALAIPRGTAFTTRVGESTFTFTTDENISLVGAGSFTANSVVIYEGDILTETFGVNHATTQNFILNNLNIDTSSIKVTVMEDGGATIYEYLRASSLFGNDEDSKIFFLQGASNDRFEIVFGDDVIGRKPKDNSTLLVEYRVTNGELPNGATTFRPISTIDSESDIVVTTVTAAHSGTVSEDIESIRFNAPRHFTTQERAVTTEDYENLLRINFPEVNSVTAFGGDEATPPQYGRVFVSVDLEDIDGIPDVKKKQYYDFLKPRSPVATEPVIVDPEYMYISVDTKVKYNINRTALNVEDMRSLVVSALLEFAEANLNDFAKTLRYSRLTRAIDEADDSVISNETEVKAVKVITTTAGLKTLSFGIAIESLRSNEILFDNKRGRLLDDGAGTLVVVAAGTNQKITEVGFVDYTTGLLNFSSFDAIPYLDPSIKLYAVPVSNDISTTKNVVLNIVAEDITVTIERIRE